MTGPQVSLVSILMPVFNAEAYLAAAVESIWQQTHTHIEIVAVDDGSSDGSGTLLESLRIRSPLPFRTIRQENSGPSAALHLALSQARGEWICWLAADDYYHPDFVAANLAEAAKLSRSDLVLHCNGYLIENDGSITGTMDGISKLKPLRGHAFEQRLAGDSRMLPCTMFVRRVELERIGGFDPLMWAEDIDLFLRIGRHCWIEYITTPLFYSRYTPGSLGKKPWLFGSDVLASLEKHADLLGPSLPAWRARACENVAVACALNGQWSHAKTWLGNALDQGAGVRVETLTLIRVIGRVAVVVVRRTAISTLGREQLVRWKRRLLKQPTTA